MKQERLNGVLVCTKAKIRTVSDTQMLDRVMHSFSILLMTMSCSGVIEEKT